MQPDQPIQQPVDPMAPQPAAPPDPVMNPMMSAEPQPVMPEPAAMPTPPQNAVPASQPMTPPAQSAEPVAMAIPPAAPAGSPALEPSPMAAQPVTMAAPPAQPVVDSSQPGYVPPATMAPVSGNSANSSGKKSGKARLIIGIVIALFFVLGGGILLKDVLFTGSSISKADLVDDEANNVSFKRPKTWTKPEDGASGSDTIFTEDGKKVDESDQQLLVGSTDLGVDFDSLPKSTQDQFMDKLIESFGNEGNYTDDGCKEIGEVKVTETTQSNYSAAMQVEATCNKFTSRALKAKLKATVGIKGRDMHVVGISAVDKTWDKSADVFDEILNTFKPAE